MENQNSNGMQSYNTNYVTDSALQMRLSTDDIIHKIELFLRGKQRIIDTDATGNPLVKVVTLGERKANDLGLQTLLNRVTAIVNSAVAQGNITRDWYFDKIAEFRESLTDDIIINSVRWEIDDSDMGDIVDTICDLVELFMTRPVDNKERESYANTIRTTESNTINNNERPKLFG